jgi:parallel beta-helix repeat protein
LDCQGHTIDGIDTEYTYGIYAYRSEETTTNITIKNCILTDWWYGIWFDYSDFNTLTNIVANSNNDGIFLWNSNFNTLTNIVANFNAHDGISTSGSPNTTLTNVTANYNDFSGISLDYSDSNTLTNVTANSNFYAGLRLDTSNSIINNSRFENNSNWGIYSFFSRNLIYNNLFNNTNNFYIYRINSNWNTTRQAGTRIYSNGTEIGGNYWTNPNGNGYSDTCEDSDKDGFCDQPYDLLGDGSNVDYLPLSDEYSPPPEVVPPVPRLYQLSPIAGMLAYILLPIVFALVAQKYLLGEVELTVQGLIKYLLLFIMVIIVAIGFAYVFSVL